MSEHEEALIKAIRRIEQMVTVDIPTLGVALLMLEKIRNECDDALSFVNAE